MWFSQDYVCPSFLSLRLIEPDFEGVLANPSLTQNATKLINNYLYSVRSNNTDLKKNLNHTTTTLGN